MKVYKQITDIFVKIVSAALMVLVLSLIHISCVFILIGLAVIGNACLKAWKKKPET